MSKLTPEIDSEESLRQAFQAFDEHKEGFVKANDLRHAMATLGDKMTEEDIDAFFKEAVITSDGKMYYEDFISMLVTNKI